MVEDNCCQCNYVALRKMVDVAEVEVIYATFHVDVGETPFFVALDFTRKKVSPRSFIDSHATARLDGTANHGREEIRARRRKEASGTGKIRLPRITVSGSYTGCLGFVLFTPGAPGAPCTSGWRVTVFLSRSCLEFAFILKCGWDLRSP